MEPVRSFMKMQKLSNEFLSKIMRLLHCGTKSKNSALDTPKALS